MHRGSRPTPENDTEVTYLSPPPDPKSSTVSLGQSPAWMVTVPWDCAEMPAKLCDPRTVSPPSPSSAAVFFPFSQVPGWLCAQRHTGESEHNEEGSVCDLNCRLPADRPVITVVYTEQDLCFSAKNETNRWLSTQKAVGGDVTACCCGNRPKPDSHRDRKSNGCHRC